MDKQYSVIITQANPPYAPECVLRLRAKSEKDAQRKAADWIADQYVFFAEEGLITEDELEEEVEIIDIPEARRNKNNGE